MPTREQRQLQKALEQVAAKSYAAGTRDATQRTFESVLRTASAFIIAAEYAEVAALVTASGIGVAIGFLLRPRDQSWERRWINRLAPIVAAVMIGVTEAKRRELIAVSPIIGERFGVIDTPSDEHVQNLGKAAATSRDDIARVLQDARERGSSVQEASRAIRDTQPDIVKSRSDFIARNVLVTSSRLASYEQAKQSGVVSGKTWKHSLQPNPREAHVEQDGKTVALGERFPDGSEYPGDMAGDGGGYNCRCSLGFELKPEFLGGV